MKPPEPDIDQLLMEHRRVAPGPRCRVCTLLASLPASSRDKLELALADRDRYTGRNLVSIFNGLIGENQPSVSLQAVDRHRRHECSAHRHG